MKKIFSLAFVLFAALLFTNSSASAQIFVGGGRAHVGVVIGGAYAPQVAIAPNYNSYACEYDEYNQPFNCQLDYSNQGYYVNGCGYDYACGGYYGGYYGRDYRYERRDNGYRGGAYGPRGGYPVQRGFGGQGGGGFQGGSNRGGGVSRGGGRR